MKNENYTENYNVHCHIPWFIKACFDVAIVHSHESTTFGHVLLTNRLLQEFNLLLVIGIFRKTNVRKRVNITSL